MGIVPSSLRGKPFDLQRYAGQWYEVARYPNAFQGKCAQSIANYTLLEDGKQVKIENTCLSANGQVVGRPWDARAIQPNPSLYPAALQITEMQGRPALIPGSYWVLDTDYENWALVGSDLLFWILWRKGDPATGRPIISQEQYQMLLAKAKQSSPPLGAFGIDYVLQPNQFAV